MSATVKTFFLGVGAQKAGTSWLHYYLSSSDKAAFENVKEYHVWDALYLPLCKSRLVSKNERHSGPDRYIRYYLQQSPESYFDHFALLLDNQSKSITFDITPSYAGLSRDIFSAIKQGFSRREIVTKSIFLMRDPIDRCWSSARKGSLRRTGSKEVSEEQVVAHAMTEEAAMRTRYHTTIEELEAAFAPDQLYCGLYEEIFLLKRIDRLATFCDVENRPALLEKIVFGSEKKQELSDDAKRMIATRYRDVYEYVAKRFPLATELWAGYRYL